MVSATREIEVRVRIPHGKNDATDVLALLAEHQLPTVTRSYTTDNTGLMLLLTTNQPEEVQRVVRAAGYRCDSHAVILVGPTSARPGAAARLLGDLKRQGVNIQYSYLSAIDPEHCYLVFKAATDEQMLKAMAVAN
ncbi:MAG: hypothetical protein WCG79_00430 [Verrucomicrobiota bacterium]|jgi:hypothetical protein